MKPAKEMSKPCAGPPSESKKGRPSAWWVNPAAAKARWPIGIVNFLGPNGKIINGHVRFQGDELVGRSEAELKKLRGDRIAMVFQDPMQALNPSIRLGEQLTEVLTCHQDITQADAWERSVAMLKRVNMPDPENVMDRYSHQISGGQQQRVVIAMAMLNNPALLIMDEPTTALDVTVEATVLDLIEELKNDFQAANIFITHNLGVVARVSDYVVRHVRRSDRRKRSGGGDLQEPVTPLHHGAIGIGATSGANQDRCRPAPDPRAGPTAGRSPPGRMHLCAAL